MESKYSFVTFLGTDSFLPGVLALHQSLKKYNRRYPLLVLITDLVSQECLNILQQKNIACKRVGIIENPHSMINDDRNFKHMFTKLRIFELAEFDKVVYLDADMLICANIEGLFGQPHLSAVASGALYPGNESWRDFNAGLLVVEPGMALANAIYAAIRRLPSADGSDQGFLHSFYNTWPSDSHLHLGHQFNVPSVYIDEYCRLFPFTFTYKCRQLNTNLAIIHYWGRYKPWNIDIRIFSRKTEVKCEQAFVLWRDVFIEAAAGVSVR